MLAAIPHYETTERPSGAFGPDALATLDKIRRAAARARCAAQMDVFSACALLSRDGTVAAAAFCEALLRALRSAFGRAPVFYAPGAEEISRDEAWVLRLVLCAAEGREDSVAFLTRRRLPPQSLRPILFLARSLA
ncbi:MAG: hypothetical protein AAF322_11080, partial [Pseudomonadota bacterium]